jgi:hypothetical protein
MSELEIDFEHFKESFNKPVLNYEDFGNDVQD